jgi:transcriptional regulator with XRE-family HTH domain
LTTISKLREKLAEPEYRKAFVASQINIGIPFQIRSLLKARGKTQGWLAEKTGMLQPRISGLMTPGKTRPNIETLRRVAEAFDCGLAVRFTPFSELAEWSETFDPEAFNVPDFETETAAIERERVARATQEHKEAASRAFLEPYLRSLATTRSHEGISLQEMARATPISPLARSSAQSGAMPRAEIPDSAPMASGVPKREPIIALTSGAAGRAEYEAERPGVGSGVPQYGTPVTRIDRNRRRREPQRTFRRRIHA